MPKRTNSRHFLRDVVVSLLDGFGNKTRIDYGTGMDVHVIWLLLLLTTLFLSTVLYDVVMYQHYMYIAKDLS